MKNSSDKECTYILSNKMMNSKTFSNEEQKQKDKTLLPISP